MCAAQGKHLHDAHDARQRLQARPGPTAHGRDLVCVEQRVGAGVPGVLAALQEAHLRQTAGGRAGRQGGRAANRWIQVCPDWAGEQMACMRVRTA